MWQKIKCWLGFHKTDVRWIGHYGKVVEIEYCIYCNKTISEKELINND